MSRGISVVAANALLDELFGSGASGANGVAPATYYIGLSTSVIASNGTGVVEPVGKGYARKAVINNNTNFLPAGNGIKYNGKVITFSTATASWGTITSFAMYSGPTASNIIAWGDLNIPTLVDAGGTLALAVGALAVSIVIQ